MPTGHVWSKCAHVGFAQNTRWLLRRSVRSLDVRALLLVCSCILLVACGRVGFANREFDGNTPQDGAMDSGNGAAILQMARGGGGDHTCIITSGNDLWCWGSGSSGELGGAVVRARPPQRVNLPLPVVDVAAGEFGTCAITSDRHLWCWGEEVPGIIANPTPRQMSLPDTVDKVAVGQNTRCALLTNGSLWCWGRNGSGQAGQAGFADQLVPAEVLPAGSSATAVSVGDLLSCTIIGGVPKCFGVSYPTAPATATPTNRPLPGGRTAASISGGCHQHYCATASDGTAWCLGLNNYRQLGNNSTSSSDAWVQVIGFGATNPAIDISPGASHTCARTASAVWCWGRNVSGQVGQPVTTAVVALPARVPSYDGVDVAGFFTGCGHNCAFVGGHVTCFGANGGLQLGDGSGVDSPTPVTARVGPDL